MKNKEDVHILLAQMDVSMVYFVNCGIMAAEKMLAGEDDEIDHAIFRTAQIACRLLQEGYGTPATLCEKTEDFLRYVDSAKRRIDAETARILEEQKK